MLFRSLGTVISYISQIVSVSGVQTISSIGSVSVTGTANIVPTGVSATGYIRNVNVWGIINNGQNPDWNAINNSQTPNWNNINNSQSPNWNSIGGRLANILSENDFAIETENSYYLKTEQVIDLWQTIDDNQSPNWEKIAV